MSRNIVLLNNRNEKIRKRYETLANKKYNGVELYRFAAILEMLSEEFFLAPRTIEWILSSKPEPDNQLNMFPEDEQQ